MTKGTGQEVYLIMMAICLTTMLLVIISTVGNGVIRLQKSQAASWYGSNYGLFITPQMVAIKRSGTQS